jgi:hypothetical protein
MVRAGIGRIVRPRALTRLALPEHHRFFLSWAVCGPAAQCILGGLRSGILPYGILNVYGVFIGRFARETAEERLDLKSLKGQTKAKELRTPCPELLSLRLALKALKTEPFCRKDSRKTAEPRVHRGGTNPLLKRGSV